VGRFFWDSRTKKGIIKNSLNFLGTFQTKNTYLK
jgi:hypothetical protein